MDPQTLDSLAALLLAMSSAITSTSHVPWVAMIGLVFGLIGQAVRMISSSERKNIDKDKKSE